MDMSKDKMITYCELYGVKDIIVNVLKRVITFSNFVHCSVGSKWQHSAFTFALAGRQILTHSSMKSLHFNAQSIKPSCMNF